MNTYWNENGKHQEWVDKTSEIMPSMYYTDNKYMNVFIAIGKIYYDIYNNGGGNLLDGCHKEALMLVREFAGRFNLKRAIKDPNYLEERTNTVFEKLMKEDLSFVNHGFWNECKKRKISMKEKNGENWVYITCGTEENVKKEFEFRKNYGFEVVE